MLLYLPFAGSYGLFDPWETHYGEVARQMTERNDFVSLYWPGSPLDGQYFWSKPVLTFWLMSLSMHLRASAGRARPRARWRCRSAPEWALRVPFCLMALLALYGVYLVASRFVSRRAGVLSVVVLATCPMFTPGGPPGDDRHAVRRPHDPGPGAGHPGAVRGGRPRPAPPELAGACPGRTTRCST